METDRLVERGCMSLPRARREGFWRGPVGSSHGCLVVLLVAQTKGTGLNSFIATIPLCSLI